MTNFYEWLLEGRNQQNLSRFVTRILRHAPEEIGIKLDSKGWANVDDLINALNISRETLENIVRDEKEFGKERISFDLTGEKIRTNQGHSVDVDWSLGYLPEEPPNVLYHGTVDKNIENIKKLGLLSQKRHAVHLSPNLETAIKVGGRRGDPIVLTIQSGKMYEDGYEFVVSENGVWLTKIVPIEYIVFPSPPVR
jgi:putative RNA 2'-phosphotransferase